MTSTRVPAKPAAATRRAIGSKSGMQVEGKREFPVALLAGAGIVVLVVMGGYFLLQEHQPVETPAAQKLPFGSQEQAYAEKIRFSNLQMSRANNLLGQELTYIVGMIVNDGSRTIREMDVNVEFRDLLNQVVLREVRKMIRRNAPIAGGEQREFQLTVEHVPADWNRNYPSFIVTGLVLE